MAYLGIKSTKPTNRIKILGCKRQFLMQKMIYRPFHQSIGTQISHLTRTEVEALVTEAHQRIEAGEDWEDAVRLLDEALKRGGGQFDPAIYIQKGIILFENGKPDDALEVLSEGIR